MTRDDRGRRPLWLDLTLLVLAGVIFVTLIGLGNWQLRRLDWKLGLIEAVEARAFGAPVALPWEAYTPEAHSYLRVGLEGTFRHDLAERVKAVTELGPGHWLMTPLTTERGPVWINRGFVPQGLPDADLSRPAEPVRIEGLLRVTEPEGTLLEQNDRAAGRWVSRDVAAHYAHAGLDAWAPFIVEPQKLAGRDSRPPGGFKTVRVS
ncbi:MAG: SURF1 family cytochrome oxidase biogenesis protein, partial [Pseudomonadota bacterium]